MMNKYKMLLYTVSLIVGFASCTPTNKKAKVFLPSSELAQVIALVDTNTNDSTNYHLLFSEILNDSTEIVEIFKNQVPATTRLGPYETISYKHNKVFVYKPHYYNINRNATIESKPNPFYLIDAPYWKILVQKRNNIFYYYQINVISTYGIQEDEELKDIP